MSADPALREGVSEMTDLEITRLCAIAIGLVPWKLHPSGEEQISSDHSIYVADDYCDCGYSNYDPLHDNSQAFDLVSHFRLRMDYVVDANGWDVFFDMGFKRPPFSGFNADLNRAICLCVAEMQGAK